MTGLGFAPSDMADELGIDALLASCSADNALAATKVGGEFLCPSTSTCFDLPARSGYSSAYKFFLLLFNLTFTSLLVVATIILLAAPYFGGEFLEDDDEL